MGLGTEFEGWLFADLLLGVGDEGEASLGEDVEAFAGISLYLDDIEEDLVERFADIALEGRTVSINATPQSLARHGTAIRLLDGCLVLVSHLGSPRRVVDLPPAELHDALARLLRLADLAHVAVKVSGLYDADPEFPHEKVKPTVALISETFGPSRLLWGSDFPVALDHLGMREAMETPDWFTEIFSPDEVLGVLGGNLDRLVLSRPVNPTLRV
ncbi:amidohydrolase family protein [Glaciihabitans sp. UYNi722]|uniref:amidohydrolase family protein n=1 Tax=Glaciihabitans sp. UYNi722 TaxID=3156344 RepID=UPI0033992712